MKRWVWLLFCLSGPAWGQTMIVVESRNAVSPPEQATYQEATPGGPHVCAIEDYPRTAIVLRRQGNTKMSFIITDKGAPSAILIDETSGDDALDQAAIACAKRWIYRPALVNGKPIQSPAIATVRWLPAGRVVGNLMPETKLAPVALEMPHDCSAFAPRKTVPPAVVTTLKLTVTVDGTVKDAAVNKSSGDDAFDQAAVRCAVTWRYVPARDMTLGTPFEKVWYDNVAWRAN